MLEALIISFIIETSSTAVVSTTATEIPTPPREPITVVKLEPLDPIE